MNQIKDFDTLTYTALKTFRNCRKMYDLRYNRGLVPLEEDESLALGSAFHGCMERWYKRPAGEPVEQVIKAIHDYIDSIYPDRLTDDRQRKCWHLLRSMFTAYVNRYRSEDFEVVAVEQEFSAPIINPETNCASRTFIMSGKVDTVVLKDGQYFIVEHKTASNIDSGYIERLPMDFQINLYSDYLGRARNMKIAGVLYNVVGKAMLKQGKGETEEEFQARRAELIAKSKTGKSSAKRKMPESDEDFQERLSGKYQEEGMFHRELLYFYPDQFNVLHAEVWELTQQLLLARRTGFWYMNSDYCFHYNKPCAYFPICRSGDNPNVIANLYREIEPHPELQETTPADAPVF